MEAQCRFADVDQFFVSAAKLQVRVIRDWCERCPVRVDCLSDAMSAERGDGTRYGIRGGLTAAQRLELELWRVR